MDSAGPGIEIEIWIGFLMAVKGLCAYLFCASACQDQHQEQGHQCHLCADTRFSVPWYHACLA